MKRFDDELKGMLDDQVPGEFDDDHFQKMIESMEQDGYGDEGEKKITSKK
jgi:hypothetical protein